MKPLNYLHYIIAINLHIYKMLMFNKPAKSLFVMLVFIVLLLEKEIMKTSLELDLFAQ